MNHRFDHLVIGVRDLEAAAGLYRDALGFDVRLGGRHTKRGTHNALIRFGLDYLELIAVFDEAEAEQAGRGTLVEFLRRREHGGGHVAYALATDDAEALARQLDEFGLGPVGPFAMQRVRPDGSSLAWRLLWPGGDAYRRPWPFFIQWDQPAAERLAGDPPGQHPNGAQAVDEVAVAVHSLDRGIDLYRRQLDLPFVSRGSVADLAANSASFDLDGRRVVLLAPSGPGAVAEALETMGEGVFQVVIGVERLEAARRWLVEHGTAMTPAPGLPDGLLIDPARAAGARLVLTDRR